MSTNTPFLNSTVGSITSRLQENLLSNDSHRVSAARSDLSRLRQGVDRSPERAPLTWHLVLENLIPELPEERVSFGDKPSNTEITVYQSLCLFAVHQQSQTRPMHKMGEALPYAVGRLAHLSGSTSIKPRFDALILAPRSKQRIYHLRSLITLLRAYELPCDYGQLAQDLFDLEIPKRKDRVILRWSRQFELGLYKASTSTSATSNT